MPFRATHHLSDEELLALATGDGGRASRASRQHVESCADCRLRSVELTRVPALLHDVGEREETPRRDLVRGAVRRLTFHRRQITNVNELFGALRAMVRGLSTLLAIEEPPFAPAPRAERPSGERSDG